MCNECRIVRKQNVPRERPDGIYYRQAQRQAKAKQRKAQHINAQQRKASAIICYECGEVIKYES